MDGDQSPSLDPAKKGRATELFIHLQTCKEFGIDPLVYLVDEKAQWKDYPHLKILLFAFRLLIAEEEERRMKEIDNKNTSKD
jgi:hypothetical protein